MKKFFILLFCFMYSLSSDAVAMSKKPPTSSTEYTQIPSDARVPLSLEESYHLALKQNESLAITKENISIATADVILAARQAIGNVSFEMTYFNQQPQNVVFQESGGGTATGSIIDPQKQERKFHIDQPIFQGFKALGAVMGSGSFRKQRKDEYNRAKQLLFSDVVNAFYDYLYYLKDIEIIRDMHVLFVERIDELKERERIGRSRLSEVMNVQSQLKILEADLARSQGNLKFVQAILEFLLGVPLDDKDLVDHSTTPPLDQTMSTYLEYAQKRPDVYAAEEAAKASWRNIIIQQSGLWPTITFEHNHYERRENLLSGVDFDSLFTINIPLSRGGENIGKIKKAVSQWKQAKLTLERTEREAEKQIKQTHDKWLSSVNAHQALKEAVDAAQETFRLQDVEYRRSLVSNLDVLQSLETLHQARRNETLAFYEMKKNYWNFQVAIGECCESI